MPKGNLSEFVNRTLARSSRYTLKPLRYRKGAYMLYRDGLPYREATDAEIHLLGGESVGDQPAARA